MRIGGIELSPAGGMPGCLLMVAISVVGSVLLTVLINLVLR